MVGDFAGTVQVSAPAAQDSLVRREGSAEWLADFVQWYFVALKRGLAPTSGKFVSRRPPAVRAWTIHTEPLQAEPAQPAAEVSEAP